MLVAHNCSFDQNFLLTAVKQCYLDTEFKNCVSGFSDSLVLFKKEFKALKKHNLTFLAKNLLNIEENVIEKKAHDALFDVQILKRLVIENIKIQSLMGIAKNVDEIEKKKK